MYVRVGPELEVFAIDKGLLCSQSGYFRSCFEGNFTGSSESLVTLEDDDPIAFRRFDRWLHTGKILDEGETFEEVSWEHLCNIYVFAEKRLAWRFQNTCVDAMIQRHAICGNMPRPAMVQYIWENTADSAPLRAFLVDLWAQRANLRSYLTKKANVELLSQDFLASVLVAFHDLACLGSVNMGDEFWKNRCKYHVHGKGVTCIEEV